MLLSNRISSIPCPSRHSISMMMTNDQNIFDRSLVSIGPSSPSIASSLQCFNMRVTHRLHRYRTLKRQWQEIVAAIQNDSISIPKLNVPLSTGDITAEQTLKTNVSDKTQDYISTLAENHDKSSIIIDPLHMRIEHDLVQPRNSMKSRRREVFPSRANTNNELSEEISPMIENQGKDNTKNLRKSSFLNQAKLYDGKRNSASQIRPSTFPQNNLMDQNLLKRHSSSYVCTPYLKQPQKRTQQDHHKIVNTYRIRINACSYSNAFVHRIIPAEKKTNVSPTSSAKQIQPYRFSMLSTLKTNENNLIQQENVLPSISSSNTEQFTTCSYTYAASTSSAIPNSMTFNRDKSLLPILLRSVCCTGTQKHCNKCQDDYYDLLCYKQLINHLPKPIITIRPRYNQDDYGMLFAQLDHIRETMPNIHVYDHYKRIC